MALGNKIAAEYRRLQVELRELCYSNRVNNPEDIRDQVAAGRAADLESRIATLQRQKNALIGAAGRVNVRKAWVGSAARHEAMRLRVYEAVTKAGGTRAVNKSALARSLGMARATICKYVAEMVASEAATPSVCPCCKRPLP
jgi:hypothetical protein